MIRRPVLRYPGGKFKLAKWIVSHFPAHRLYVEPFCGAASVLMAKPRSEGEVINDLDQEVVNVFRVLRDPIQAKELERVLRLTPMAYEEYAEAYEPCDDPIERARRQVFRSFASIGSDGVSRRASGFRGLKNYQSYVTAGTEWSRYPDAIRFFVERLKGVTIENRDAFQIIKRFQRPETLFYVDPPYLMDTRSKDSVVYKKELDDQDHIRLSDTLKSLPGMVVVSGYPSKLYDELYAGWTVVKATTRAQNSATRTECLWLSPNIKTTLF